MGSMHIRLLETEVMKIEPNRTTDEQMSNETKPTMGRESRAESRKRIRRKSGREREGNFVG